jgi:hypothetical protein
LVEGKLYVRYSLTSGNADSPIQYISFIWYTNGALSANEFTSHTSDPAGQLYACPYSGGSSNPSCKPYTGMFIMESLGYPKTWTWRPFLILVMFVLVFYASAALLLRSKKAGVGIARTQTSQEMKTTAGGQVLAEVSGTSRRFDIFLDGYGLNIIKRGFLGKNFSEKTLLHPIKARFQSDKLNVIIGPSGSGKTSLLNSMANRLQNV